MKRIMAILAAVGALTLATGLTPAVAEEGAYDAALADVEQTLGMVPTFMRQLPQAGFAGAWQQLKELELSEDTALPAKVKSLIALGVVSQIPCDYCIWAATLSAKAAGASDEEIGEAVAVAATERYWSTMLNGLQVDMGTFQAEFGPLFGETSTAR
jgi:AhpD family alkylhydroperoxidase